MINKKEDKIPILSFFSGGGFLDMGFEQAGFSIIWTNEVNKVFAEMHAAGITSWRKSIGNGTKAEIFNTSPIESVSIKQILKEAFPDGKNDFFGMIGGPPCQDFSFHGSKNGFNGERGKLTQLYFHLISRLKPAFFVMENVPGLVRIRSNKEELEKLLSTVKKSYHIDRTMLNALQFAVPQFRERVFIVGIKKGLLKEKDLTVKINGNWFPWADGKYNMEYLTSLKWPSPHPFGATPTKPKEIPFELCVESILIKNGESEIPNAEERFNLHGSKENLCQIKEGETTRPSFKRPHRYKYSPTACYGNNEVHLHPYKHTRLSVRETLRIQGVPDEYVLPSGGSLSKKFKMIGNGVPVPMAYAVAQSLQQFIKDKKLIRKSLNGHLVKR